MGSMEMKKNTFFLIKIGNQIWYILFSLETLSAFIQNNIVENVQLT